MSKRHTVSITSSVYTRLRNHGRFGESFNDLVNRLSNLQYKLFADKVSCECKCHKDIGSGPRKAPEPTGQEVSQSSQVVNLNDHTRAIR